LFKGAPEFVTGRNEQQIKRRRRLTQRAHRRSRRKTTFRRVFLEKSGHL
jgi:hypothetical protein